MSNTDYYEILGIENSATDNDVKRAFRTLAKKFHPDKNPGNEQSAEQKFKEIITAYQVLIDQEKRRSYDITLKRIHQEAELRRKTSSPNRKSNDIATLCQMILVELLRPNKRKALDLYEELLAKIPDFRIEKFMDDGDSRDCEFLIAEAYQQSGRLSEAEFMYKKLLEKEDKKPYFHHFAQEIKDLLKDIFIKNISTAESSTNIALNLQKLLKMSLSNYDIAWAYKKSAEAYYRISDYENAIASLSLAFDINPKLPGAKKISRKLGFVGYRTD